MQKENKKGMALTSEHKRKYGVSSILHKSRKQSKEGGATTIYALLEIAVGGLCDELVDVDKAVEYIRIYFAGIL